ncbi:MAG: hypothetical protein HY033_07640 [Ignavibacteriae bacterium]|nr:hypothetical protein [Ignavibacteriota bacterium]
MRDLNQKGGDEDRNIVVGNEWDIRAGSEIHWKNLKTYSGRNVRGDDEWKRFDFEDLANWGVRLKELRGVPIRRKNCPAAGSVSRNCNSLLGEFFSRDTA